MWTEEAFVNLYGVVVEKAKEALTVCNAEREEPGDWPAGQEWKDLSGSSKAIFMKIARAELGINHEEFLKIVRNWPYSDTAWSQVEYLFA